MTTITKTKSKKRTGVAAQSDNRLFTLEVLLLDGPLPDKFFKTNKKVSRTIAMRGDNTLEDLHEAIFKAFDRYDHHLYEFQIGGKKPMDHTARRYAMSCDNDNMFDDGDIAGKAETTTIGSVDLQQKDKFFYWFDFGDDWFHQINVISISENAPAAEYPQITHRVGDSPPQYLDDEE